IVCNSGTAALHLAYLALGLGPERGLLTSPITFLATASAARMCDAPVAFCDVDVATGNPTSGHMALALDAATIPLGAATVVHVGGRPCDMSELRRVTSGRGVALVEDACHAPLASYRDRDGAHFSIGACTHSDVAVFSFHPIKHVAM